MLLAEAETKSKQKTEREREEKKKAVRTGVKTGSSVSKHKVSGSTMTKKKE